MFKWLWKHSFLFYLVNFLKYAIENRSDKKQFGYTLTKGMFPLIAKKYLNVDLEKDWVGRMYGIINPNVDINGNFDPGTMIIEMDGENTNNNEYVNTWIYKQLRLMSSIFSLKGLYDKLTIDIKHVGPEEFDNYLVVFDFESRQNKVHYRKKLLLRILVLLLIAAATVTTIILL
jgi:hypothetical protein